MSIHVLSETVASRIAAGEVVERPASVVKEMVENSLDAGATRVEVETRQGGKRLIRVRDNGEGIHSAEVHLAFQRHATSKLSSAEDLEHIATLGFRGEALASITSVSRVTCITRHTDEQTGTRLRLEGGKIISESPLGRPQGTEMLVEDLFYNVPARRKFLRTERTERRHIDAFLTRYAIAYPQTAFYAVHDGNVTLNTPGNGSAREVLLNVYGLELGASLLEIPPAHTEGDSARPQAIRVRGFVGPTTVHRADRGYITLFMNGRWIQDLRLTYAIIQAYHTLLPTKRYPIAFVIVEMPPEEVDVNVHPTKSEVRFKEADKVFRAIQRAVRATVIQEAPAAATWHPSTEHRGEGPSQPKSQQQNARARLSSLQPAQQISLPESSASTDTSTPPKPLQVQATGSPSQPPQRLPPLRIIGQASTMFIIAEGPDGLYLIDQHAAHERVLYEQMHAAWVKGDIPSQTLLEPESVTLPPDEADKLEPMLPALKSLGLNAETFGPHTFLVRAIPALLSHVSVHELLADIATTANGHDSDYNGGHNGGRDLIREELEESVIRRICKRGAVKAGQVLSTDEMGNLVRALENTQNPRTCPHGRPTIIQISVEQLIRQFGRS
jgi:DNA mismatch repair protein MutL